MHVIKAHWLQDVRYCRSPNYDDRPECQIDTVVIHNISLPPGEFGGQYINNLFTNSLDASVHDYFREICHLKVSSHLLIDRQGVVTQYVSFDKRAWHAGLSSFLGRNRFNDFSIGIELEGTDWLPYDARQYIRLAEIINTLQRHYPRINNNNLVGHSTISPGRKTDPGPAFDWWRLRGLLTALAE